MADWSDEELSAFIDGALPADKMSALEADMERDPDLVSRIEQLGAVDARVRSAFGSVFDEEAPARLRALVENAQEPDAPQAQKAEIIDFSARRKPSPPQAPVRVNASRLAWPIAAGLALVVGFSAGNLMSVRQERQLVARVEAGAIDRDNLLFNLLEQAPSAQSVQFDREAQFKPILTFAAADGRFCREFELQAREATSIGVACREDGKWRLMALLAAADRAPGQTGYAPVSGYDEKALEIVLDRLGGEAPLSPEAERELMRKQWRR